MMLSIGLRLRGMISALVLRVDVCWARYILYQTVFKVWV